MIRIHCQSWDMNILTQTLQNETLLAITATIEE